MNADMYGAVSDGNGGYHSLAKDGTPMPNSEPCLDCEMQGNYPSGGACKSCGGAGLVPKGSNGDVTV